MIVEYGIMSNKWSVEADNKLTCYVAIIVHLKDSLPLVALYTEECKNDQWLFADDIEKRIGEIFGGTIDDFFNYEKDHQEEIQKAVNSIKKLV